jgi:hypothetical protein
MALTQIQALDVVIGSVNGVSGQSPNPAQTLKQGGITDAGRLGAFKSVVVTDLLRGVKKHAHEIVASTLSGVAVDDGVQATADVIRSNATPIPAAGLLSAAEDVAPPAPARPARAQKAAAKKSARKSAKKSAAKKSTKTKGTKTKTPARKTASRRKPSRKTGTTRASKRATRKKK